jgi:hypothetical protein
MIDLLRYTPVLMIPCYLYYVLWVVLSLITFSFSHFSVLVQQVEMASIIAIPISRVQ